MAAEALALACWKQAVSGQEGQIGRKRRCLIPLPPSRWCDSGDTCSPQGTQVREGSSSGKGSLRKQANDKAHRIQPHP